LSKDQTPPTKVGGTDSKDASKKEVTPDGLISLDELDQIIQQSDPEFNSKMAQISSVPSLKGANLELLDLDQIIEEEESNSFRARRHRFQRRIYASVTMRFEAFKTSVIRGLSEGIPAALHTVKNQIIQLKNEISRRIEKFKYLDVKHKLALIGIFFLAVFVMIFIYRAATVGVIPSKTQLFVNSMEEWAQKTHTYNPEQDQEPFYDSARVKQNIMSLRRAVVNLKPSESSGPNPMAFFEFYLEGNSADVVVELKDREYDVIDQVQRMIEDMTFNEIDSVDGKMRLTERIRKELNSFLTTGKVKRVYIKQGIVKP